MTSWWCLLAVSITLLSSSSSLVDAKCPPPGNSLCNCSEVVGTTNELLVACDGQAGMVTVMDLKYQLDGIPEKEIVELAIYRLKNWQGLRTDFFDKYEKLTRLGLAANPNGNFKLPVGIFEKIGKQITTLDLSTCNLTEKDLPPALLEPLVNLKEIDLSWNNIQGLRRAVFDAIPSVQTIDLGDNKLTQLLPYLFAGVKNLTMLDLNDNLLTEFPPDLFEDPQPALKILDIGGNKISKLTAAHFAMMPNLTVLDARKNPINVLPPDLFSQTPQLGRLSLNGIQASVLPASLFKGLPLESLDLSNSGVRSYPETLLTPVASTLEELHLDNSINLFSLPPKFFKGMDVLESVDMSNTGLDLLPSTFFTDLKGLKKLKISDNRWLISLPPPKDFSENLKIIDAKNCPKLPPVVTKWIANNFDSRPQLMDFPINIYRSVNREILQRIIPAAPTTTVPPTTTPPPNKAQNWNNNNNGGYNNNNGGYNNGYNNYGNNNNGNYNNGNNGNGNNGNNGNNWNNNNGNNNNGNYNNGNNNNGYNNNGSNGNNWNNNNNGNNNYGNNNNGNGGNNSNNNGWGNNNGNNGNNNNGNNNNGRYNNGGGGGWGWGR
ncbi:putative Leucine-rich repeat-containing protein 15 [Hypsibius exemplaris]|uniref:Leucine-rich repeat-containing protein 15 n=1 Tax=Hypsibius exemplaris TaxID=2072580 RepID=A0A1W0XAH4_HYPEX|nr:putative Leucine-rich repeat-containing protein 15 [Hypsibius exemplaris]